MWIMYMNNVRVKPIMKICMLMKKTQKRLQREKLKPLCVKGSKSIQTLKNSIATSMVMMVSQCDQTHVDDDYRVTCELVNLVATNEFGEVEIVNEHMHA